MDSIVLKIIVLFFLILLNGFFSMTGLAILAARKSRLKSMFKHKAPGSASALFLRENREQFLSAIQIAVTLLNILVGALAGIFLSPEIGPLLTKIKSLVPYAETLAFVLTVMLVFFLLLVFGELVPKRLALIYPERLAVACAPVMHFLLRVFLPVVTFLNFCAKIIVHSVSRKNDEQNITEEDIKAIIGESPVAGAFEEAEKDILERLLRLDLRPVRTLMTHRTDIEWIDLEEPWEENMDYLMSSRHSFIPVARDDISDVFGVLKVKDALAAKIKSKDAQIRFEDFMLEPVFVFETISAMDLLVHFRRHPGAEMAFVVDEYGEVDGLVTLSDIFAALSGASINEEGTPEASIVQCADGTCLVDGLAPINEVVETLGLDINDEDTYGYRTLAGYYLKMTGRIPKAGESFIAGNFRFEVVEMDERRIDKIQISRLTPPEEEPQSDETPDSETSGQEISGSST